MLTAAFWGLIQGLTEFLPVSSSGHLLLIPALLDIEEPDLTTSSILHLGTLAAVVWYYRDDLAKIARSRRDPEGGRILLLLVVGTIPAAVVGLLLHDPIDIIFSEPWQAAVALMFTGGILTIGVFLPKGIRRLAEGRVPDALVVGVAQALALIPGISRSGTTITAGFAQGFTGLQAARYAFLLGIPSVAAAGASGLWKLSGDGDLGAELLIGSLVAAVSGYLAIGALLRLLARTGLAPFAVYCLIFGAVAYVLL